MFVLESAMFLAHIDEYEMYSRSSLNGKEITILMDYCNSHDVDHMAHMEIMELFDSILYDAKKEDESLKKSNQKLKQNKYSCSSCNFNDGEDGFGNVICSKKIFTSKKVMYRSKDWKDKDCLGHSHYFTSENRYMRKNKIRQDAEDYCCICKRRLDLKNKEDYKVGSFSIGGAMRVGTVCRICLSKERDCKDGKI